MRRAMEPWTEKIHGSQPSVKRLDHAVGCHGFRWDRDACLWLGVGPS